MKHWITGIACLQLLFSGAVVLAADGEIVGSVKTVRGEAFLVRGGESAPARPGLTIRRQDTLRTGGDGSLGVLFRDDSILSLGPESTFVIEEFSFVPAERKFGFFGRVVTGTISYLSGLLGKLSPDSVRIETPDATIGIRGTKFAVQVQ